ncbi:DUF4252 domain-containing protein [Formosa sediminum]|uniref:DUF4252 domain-containing protein n=1 Tax=Formosa sediminum TaxID=2594004 RepID=A0A516GV24_9FLAO|nr:DUF4252 domain-containing protein [Formosa sediminum]QDO95369.1 DUF4252 domain-containing protein [Formosa sediminum]
MKAQHSIFILAICFTLFLTSCNSTPTLQTYIVDHQEAPNFTTVDLPLSVLKVDQTKLNEDQKTAYNAIKRLNFLGYKKETTDSDTYLNEKTQVENILNDEAYNELMVINNHGGKFTLKYLGDDDQSIDELIVYGNAKDTGFGILRVLGDDMNPSQIMSLAKVLEQGDVDMSQVEGLVKFFN